MISKQTLYLSADRSEVVKEGDPGARFLLVREGHEIADALLDKHDGAAEMANSAPKKRPEEPLPPGPTLKGDNEGPKPDNRESAMPKRRKRAK